MFSIILLQNDLILELKALPFFILSELLEFVYLGVTSALEVIELVKIVFKYGFTLLDLMLEGHGL